MLNRRRCIISAMACLTGVGVQAEGFPATWGPLTDGETDIFEQTLIRRIFVHNGVARVEDLNQSLSQIALMAGADRLYLDHSFREPPIRLRRSSLPPLNFEAHIASAENSVPLITARHGRADLSVENDEVSALTGFAFVTDSRGIEIHLRVHLLCFPDGTLYLVRVGRRVLEDNSLRSFYLAIQLNAV